MQYLLTYLAKEIIGIIKILARVITITSTEYKKVVIETSYSVLNSILTKNSLGNKGIRWEKTFENVLANLKLDLNSKNENGQIFF